jgi:hypothetical protein
MTTMQRDLPASNEALRRELYEGGLFLADPTPASQRLADDARALLDDALGGDIRTAHARFSNDDLFLRIGRLRRVLYLEPRFHDAVREALASLGFDPTRCAFDPIRIRVVLDRGHEIPGAKAVYYPHRDTWYAHPQSMIAWWIPLDDLRDDETFVFFPSFFRAPVPNDSEIFDYDDWVRRGWSLKIGWQDPKAGLVARYPSTTGPVDIDETVGFSCRRGQNLLFSGSHYHRTLAQSAGRTRYSLDFRIVQLDDHARGLGAPNVDNRSRGSCLVDYVGGPGGG